MSEECVVCLENDLCLNLRCNHIVCIKCLTNLFFSQPKFLCPICRKPLYYLKKYLKLVKVENEYVYNKEFPPLG